QNRILAGLSPADYARLLPDLELVSIAVGQGLFAAGSRITHLYVPMDCVIARLYELESGASVTTSVTGKEGMINISYLLGASRLLRER
ncbi:MAG: Crp/Fnr family transcriptional regulator, partial [Nitrosospira sp.]